MFIRNHFICLIPTHAPSPLLTLTTDYVVTSFSCRYLINWNDLFPNVSVNRRCTRLELFLFEYCCYSNLIIAHRGFAIQHKRTSRLGCQAALKCIALSRVSVPSLMSASTLFTHKFTVFISHSSPSDACSYSFDLHSGFLSRQTFGC